MATQVVCSLVIFYRHALSSAELPEQMKVVI